jgi:hypothetical protein
MDFQSQVRLTKPHVLWKSSPPEKPLRASPFIQLFEDVKDVVQNLTLTGGVSIAGRGNGNRFSVTGPAIDTPLYKKARFARSDR